MDIPEQPTVWPPAPNVAPPEPVKAKPFKLMVPEWMSYWCSLGMLFLIFSSAAYTIFDALHVHRPIWATFQTAVAVCFAIGGLMTAWKYRPRRKQQ